MLLACFVLSTLGPAIRTSAAGCRRGLVTIWRFHGLGICQVAGNGSGHGVVMADLSGGAVKSVKTTPLVTFDEGLEALKKAKDAGYTPPPSEVPYFGVYRGA